MKISQKGLILVAVPLIGEFFFVWILVGLHRQAEAEVMREVHSKTIIEHADKLMIDVLSAGTATTTYGLNVKDKEKAAQACRQFDAVSKDAWTQLQELEQLSAGRPEQLALLAESRDLYTRYDKICTKVRAAFEGGQLEDKMLRNALVFSAIRKLNEILEEITARMDTFLVHERQVEQESPQAQARNRHNIEFALFIGLALNALLAGGMAVFFSRDIAERLKVIVLNTGRLTQRQPLNPPLNGDDEIAYLDKSFHDTADRLQELDRLKNEFVSMISHDLRTPLTSIGALLEFLETGRLGELTQQGKEHVKAAEYDVDRLIGLINDLLDVERMESGQLDMVFANVQLTDVVERSRASVRQLCESRKITISTAETKETVWGDADRLVQVMVNILSNALKFSPPGSSVDITVNGGSESVEVRISDRGRGIPESHRQAIFDRFQQVELADSREKKGTGLGLAICKTIIEQHRGAIGVESEEGKGSTFWFTLPKQAQGLPESPAAIPHQIH